MSAETSLSICWRAMSGNAWCNMPTAWSSTTGSASSRHNAAPTALSWKIAWPSGLTRNRSCSTAVWVLKDSFAHWPSPCRPETAPETADGDAGVAAIRGGEVCH